MEILLGLVALLIVGTMGMVLTVIFGLSIIALVIGLFALLINLFATFPTFFISIIVIFLGGCFFIIALIDPSVLLFPVYYIGIGIAAFCLLKGLDFLIAVCDKSLAYIDKTEKFIGDLIKSLFTAKKTNN